MTAPVPSITIFEAVGRHFLFEGSDVLAQTFQDVMKQIMRLISDVHLERTLDCLVPRSVRPYIDERTLSRHNQP